jgi:hypothetical protein
VPLAQQGYQAVAIEVQPDGQAWSSTNGLPAVPLPAWRDLADGPYEVWAVGWRRGEVFRRWLVGRLHVQRDRTIRVEPVNGYLLVPED